MGGGSNSSMITVLFRKFNPPRNGSLLENFGNFGYGLNNREKDIYIYTQVLVEKIVIVEINRLHGG